MVSVTKIKTSDFIPDAAFRKNEGGSFFPEVWALGNSDIRNAPLLGFLCSVRCPGNVILRIYDLIRALREAEVPVIGGFQSPIKKECLDLLLRGKQPIAVCPARSIERMRVPVTWREPLSDGRLLVLSPFEARHRRPTAKLSEMRNRFVAMLARTLVVAYASESGMIFALCAEWMGQGRTVYTLDLPENAHLIAKGAVEKSVDEIAALVQKTTAIRFARDGRE